MKRIVCFCVCLLALWLSFLCGRKSVDPKAPIVEYILTDTTIIEINDTNSVIKPVPYKVYVYDTVFVEAMPELLIYQTKLYKDSTYTAQVSGYDAQLDWIETYSRTVIKEINTKEYIHEPVKKWNIYGFAGARMANVPECNAGLGLSYTHNRWTIAGEAGKEMLRNNNFAQIKGSFSLVRF